MPHDLFRRNVITQMNSAISKSQDAAGVDHPFLQGRIREIALENLFKPLLPAGLEIATGKVIDHTGFQSLEIDLIVYSRRVLSTIMYSQGSRLGLFPAESSFYAIEVKSTATAKEIRDAIAKAENLRNAQYLSGVYYHDVPKTHDIIPIISVFFAFTTDLAESGKSELDRYRENDPNSEVDPRLSAICVVGRGYWWFHADDKRGQWIFHSPTPDHDEVIDFLSGITNTIPDSLARRGRPRLGNYLVLPERGVAVE